MARRGLAWQGRARQGTWQGPAWRGSARRGLARNMVWHGRAGLGKAWQGKDKTIEQRKRLLTQLERLMAMLEILINKKFYGRLEIVLNEGRIVHVVKHQSVKVDES